MTHTNQFRCFAVLNEGTHIIYHTGRRSFTNLIALQRGTNQSTAAINRMAKQRRSAHVTTDGDGSMLRLNLAPLTSYGIYSFSRLKSGSEFFGIFLGCFFWRCHEQVSI